MIFLSYPTKTFRILFLCGLLMSLGACNQGSKKASNKDATKTCVTDEQLAQAGAGIVGGSKVDFNDILARRVVMVIQKGATQCTGTPITRDVILTAAHCVSGDSKNIRVSFYPSVTCRSGYNINTHSIAAKRFVIHEDYSGKLHSNDIALIQLSLPIPEHFETTSIYDGKENLLSKDFVLAGFGLTDEKSLDAFYLRAVTKNIKKSQLTYEDSELTFDQSDGQGVCSGDSGGPLFVITAKGMQLAGVNVSVVNKEDKKNYCHGRAYSTYAPSYLDWIEKKLQEWK